MEQFFLPSLVFVVFLGAYYVLTVVQERTDLRSRLKFADKKASKNTPKQDISIQKTANETFLTELVEKFRKKNKQTVENFRIRFERCGWDPHSAAFLVPLYKVCSVSVFILLFLALDIFSGSFSSLEVTYKYIAFVVFLGVGYRSFDYFTDYKIYTRQQKIVRDIPMAIDLLVVCVRAGLTFDRSLDRIAQEIIYTNPDLARELTITSAELSILPDRKVAYQNLARRVDEELVKTLTTSLTQAEEQGVAIGKTLMFLSQESSKQKLMDIERQAAKLPSKLTVPVVLLSLPAILIIILGPTIAAILESDMFGG